MNLIPEEVYDKSIRNLRKGESSVRYYATNKLKKDTEKISYKEIRSEICFRDILKEVKNDTKSIIVLCYKNSMTNLGIVKFYLSKIKDWGLYRYYELYEDNSVIAMGMSMRGLKPGYRQIVAGLTFLRYTYELSYDARVIIFSYLMDRESIKCKYGEIDLVNMPTNRKLAIAELCSIGGGHSLTSTGFPIWFESDDFFKKRIKDFKYKKVDGTITSLFENHNIDLNIKEYKKFMNEFDFVKPVKNLFSRENPKVSRNAFGLNSFSSLDRDLINNISFQEYVYYLCRVSEFSKQKI